MTVRGRGHHDDEISDEFIGEVRDSTLPREIVRLLERRAEQSRRTRLGSRPQAA